MNPLTVTRLTRYPDQRGWFCEGWKLTTTDVMLWAQDNFSWSKRGVLRGLHCQILRPQTKLVTVMQGKILDVAVEIATGKVYSFTLAEGDQVLIPNTFLHGFLALEDSLIWYKADSLYDRDSERTVRPYDEDLAIDWAKIDTTISDKDKAGKSWREVRDEYLKASQAMGRSLGIYRVEDCS